MAVRTIRRALLSVSDKTGLLELARCRPGSVRRLAGGAARRGGRAAAEPRGPAAPPLSRPPRRLRPGDGGLLRPPGSGRAVPSRAELGLPTPAAAPLWREPAPAGG